ncbi:protein mono-ADP-ribosyltransferase PARP14-like isoform X3 [Mytilus californianus]|uniref:protein mono-ADP-ribosyltransferase PARP14-like isoform X3 n=1 Tax=Mytilus californianus TaxID=6549 RepID=UPI0022484E0F|nr:protein mono-ADP-ribosyltransferase PARP14-like isoform X3 [Mytilus californianus]
MDNAEIKQIICEKCIVVRGFNNEIQFNELQKSFPESRRVNLTTRTATLSPRDKEWIILFQSVKDAQRYVEDVRILKCPEGLLDISDCKLPCDIPDEWLQDEVISDKSTGSPKHVSSGTMQPPPYSPSDPSVPPSQHSTSAHGFPPYDPRLYGPNPQNYYQHQYYPPYRMPMNPYHHGSSGKEHLPKEQYRPQHAGQWGQYPGYYQPAPYGSYPGYGYPPQSNFDFHQPVQQLPVQGNLNQYTQGNENRGNTTYHSSSLSETVQNENDVQSDGEENIPVDEDKMEDEPAQTTTNMLKVTKLPLDTTEDGLRFFFENTRKYGGGDVDDVEYDEDTRTAIITFEEDEAVDIVLQKIPILFNKKAVDVEAHIVGAESSTDIPEEEPDDSSQNTGEPVTICSVEVRGMKENTTQDTIMYYFESKKGAKADVETIEFVEDKDMYIVTFENEEAVETVLSKSHIVDGAKLQVKRHVPLKRYPNKALVKGFSPNTTKDGIINFLEARTKFDVEEVDYGDEDSGKAIVTFCEPIDIGDIQTACKKKALDKSYLTVHPVVVTNCIVVRGFSEKTTESGLEYYFDNKRKSGVEGVTDVNMNRDDDCCVIYFENAEDALLACKRSHTIDNCKLKVQVFYDCLGVPADNEGPKFKPLPSLVITDIDKYKLSFLKNSAHKKETLEKQLEDIYSKITWPASPQENKIIVECTITKETQDCRKLAKTWEKDTRMHIDSFVNLLVKEIHSILQEAWGPVMEKLREIHISDPDGVTVNLENPPTCEIIITGHSVPVKEVSNKVKKIIYEVSEDLDRKKQIVQEEVSLKRHQLFVLSFSQFSNKIRQEFEQMEIKIDTKKHVITFTGISGNISKAKVTMYETLSNIASATIGKKTPGYIQFLKRQDVKKSIAANLKSSSLIGVWEIQDNTILMYSMSDEEAVAAADILKDCVVEVKVDVDNVQKSMLSSQKWKQHVQAIQNEFERKSVVTEIVTNQQGQITVYCNTQGEAGLIKEKIQDFFLTNTEREITIDLPPSLLKFLQEEMKDEVENLEKDLRKRNIIVAVKSDGILVKGNAEGIKDAEDEVEALVQKIYKTKHSMNKPGLQELMNSNQGKTKLKHVSKHAGVVISSDSDEDERSSGHIRRRGGAGSDERAVFCGAGGQEVIVVKGDITGLDVDVIVNAANKDLAHSGGLAKVLVNKGGKGIQDECDQYTSNYGQLSEGKCFSSGPGTLKCQMIVHAVGPVWQGGSNREEERLHQCVESTLVETEQNQHTSVAIPALCTGIFGYPANQATRVIAQTVNDYFSSNRGSTVQRVYLCDVNENSVDLFVKAGDKVFGKRTDGGGKIPSGGRYSDGFSGQAGPISAGNIQIKVVKGELSKMRVDAIVNTTSKDLQLNQGAVSAALLKVGGQALQDECLQNYPKGVGYGEVAVTSGYNLPCSYVCHGSLDQWRKDGSSIKVLEKFIDRCLQEADGNGCKSIALPAMGTGKLGYPRDLVATHMYSSVEQFASQNPSSNVTEVLFVLYDKDHQTVKAFEDEEQNRQRSSGRQDRDYTQQPTGYQGRRGKGVKKEQQKQTPQTQGTPQDQDTSDPNKEYNVNMGSTVFKVYQGDITAIKVDAIVNGTNADLDFSIGAVAKAIKQKGGQELDKQLGDNKKAMKKDGIAVTNHTSGLMCKAVIHLDMTGVNPLVFGGSIASAFSVKLKDRIKLALDKAEKLQMASVAFPALGTSTNTNVKVSDIAEEMFKVVEKFHSNKTNHHVKEVHVVIFQKDMMKDFMEAVKNCVNKSKEGYIDKFMKWTGLGAGAQSLKKSRHNRHLIGTQVSQNKQMATVVSFVIYARDKNSADNAIQLLEKSVEDDIIERPIRVKIINEFTPEQINEVKKLEATGKVEVTVDTSKGEMRLRGFTKHVSDAIEQANDIIKTAEQAKQTRQKAKLVTDMVQWHYMEEDKGEKKLVEYPPEVNLILETALKDQKKDASFYDQNGNKYVVDFNSYEEYPADDPTDKVQVLRKSKLVDHAFELPLSWEKMGDKENLKVVQLKPTDQEYKDVSQKFIATSGGTKVTFVKIERIQNKTLYQQFVAKKKSMDATNPKTVNNEKQLWHGFSVDALDSINRYGFNRSYCGKNAVAFGAGVYFAVEVRYSIQDTYSRPDPSGHKRMYLCRVLTGEFCKGLGGMRVPPAKPNAAGSHILYDSVTNDMNNQIMYIIFHDSQAFPEYLVTFKKG